MILTHWPVDWQLLGLYTVARGMTILSVGYKNVSAVLSHSRVCRNCPTV